MSPGRPAGRLLGRRALLAGIAASSTVRRAWADVEPDWRPRALDVREVHVEGSLSTLFVLATPRHLESFERVPLVVLLHGLGETGDPRMGAWAWMERYGLGTAYDRLLDAGSMRGLVFACPYMPDLPVADPRAFDEYARWLADTVVPRARREASSAFDLPAYTYLGGCSLGGHFSIEVLLRRPASFSAWAGVQTAIGESAAGRYGARLAAAGAGRSLLVETSTEDPFRAGNEALSRALQKAGASSSTFVELPGPHDQPWLRRAGTPRLIQWLDDLPRPECRADPPDRRAAPF